MLLSSRWTRRIRAALRSLRNALVILIAAALLGGSVVPSGGLDSQVGTLTREVTFDFASWTMEAIATKLAGWGLSLPRFLSPQSQSDLVLTYLAQVAEVQKLNAALTLLYADPTVTDHNLTSQPLRNSLAQVQTSLDQLRPVAEAILQSQLMTVIHQAGLTTLGQVLPPSLFQSSEVPASLIISERAVIQQVLDVSLIAGLTADSKEALETSVLQQLDHSALVVPIGGIGTYPTMVMQSADLVWLTEVIAHEWVHNFLTPRPLGRNYFTTAELRTINETTASMAGKELGRMILEAFYPDQAPPPPEPAPIPSAPSLPDPDMSEPDVSDSDVFDFRREMRITREEVDRLLRQGEVIAAENYMEERRAFLWENRYPIRKLNQAYFAFYGAYNDEPGGGASGEDPVGPAVQAYRAQFDTLAEFLVAVARVNSLEALMALVE